MPLHRNAPPFPEEPIWRWILYACFGLTMAATFVTFAAGPLWGDAALGDAAGWVAIAAAAGYLFVRWLGARQAAQEPDGER